MRKNREHWMKLAIDLALENVRAERGGPFGALVVKDEQIVATGVNSVTTAKDPTAHAEIAAIRAACQKLKDFQLSGCELYASCEPCPMCLGAIYWSRLDALYFASTRATAAEAGFDDALIYLQLQLPPEERSIPGHRLLLENALAPFEAWARSPLKIQY